MIWEDDQLEGHLASHAAAVFLRHGCGAHLEENRDGHPGDQGEFQQLSPKLVDLWRRDG